MLQAVEKVLQKESAEMPTDTPCEAALRGCAIAD